MMASTDGKVRGEFHATGSMRRRLGQHLLVAAESVVGRACIDSVTLRDAGLHPPKFAAHGDFSSPIALALAKAAGKPPRALAEQICAALGSADGLLCEAVVAGPGHINCRIARPCWLDCLWQALNHGETWLHSDVGAGRRVLLEFVSANPTGPLHLAHGRGAVYGDVLARLLRAAGCEVTCEYYVNDYGNQTDVLAQSVWAHLRALNGGPFEPPPSFYPGEYVKELAERLRASNSQLAEAGPDAHLGEDALSPLREQATATMLQRIKADLAKLDVPFDSFVSERQILNDASVPALLARLKAAGHLYEEDGKQWFRTTTFGDDKDRVLVREDGRPTYVLGDIAYHEQKAKRGFTELINVWGADHAGYVARVKAGLAALGHDPAQLTIDFVQMVSISRAGEPVKMGKRLGTAVWLSDAIDETGRDAIRYWFLLRRLDAQMELDLDLAEERSLKNPVFYAQMGHARLAAIGRRAEAEGVGLPPRAAWARTDLDALGLPEEMALIAAIASAPDVVADAALAREPHAVVAFIQALIAQFHSYYGRYKQVERVISADPHKTRARLLLCQALAEVLRGLLGLVGVDAPAKMELVAGEDIDPT